MVLGLSDGDGFAEVVAGADVGCDFEFVVELERGGECGAGGVGELELAAGAKDIRAADDE